MASSPGVVLSGRTTFGLADVTGQPAAGKIGDFKISLAEWSLHKALFGKQIDNLDFPKIAREEYGIEGVEFVNQFFKDKAHDSAYLKDLKGRANDIGVTCVLIMIDGEGDLSAEDKRRDKAVENHKKWVDAAARSAATRSASTRAATTARPTPTRPPRLRPWPSTGEEQHQHHLREPRRAVEQSRRPDRAHQGRQQPEVRHPARLRQLPQGQDGKYAIDVYDAIARMMPYAKGVSAKSYDFDADGRETRLDYARILKIVTDAGYHNWVGIEYEGGRLTSPKESRRPSACSSRSGRHLPARRLRGNLAGPS